MRDKFGVAILARLRCGPALESEYPNHDGQPDRQTRTSVLVRGVSSWRWNHAGDRSYAYGHHGWTLPPPVATSRHLYSCINLGAEGCVVQAPRHWVVGMGSYPHVCSIRKRPSIVVLGDRARSEKSKRVRRANSFSPTPAEDRK